MATGAISKPYETRKLNITSPYGDITYNNSFISGDIIYVDIRLTITSAITAHWDVYAAIDAPLATGVSIGAIVETGGNNFSMQGMGARAVIARYATANVGDSFRLVFIGQNKVSA